MRANDNEASISLVVVATRLLRIDPSKLGNANATRIATIAIVIISSMTLKPETRLWTMFPNPSNASSAHGTA